ncbi:MAG: hypothetical protein IJD68_05195 [Ruminococcus sp.]|nr:hypothetical protein [Ruminococcus sp.]
MNEITKPMRNEISSAFSITDIGTDILAHIEMTDQNLTFCKQGITAGQIYM